MNSLQLMGFFITFSLTLHSSLAWRNYNLLLTDIKCIVNPDFISHASCMIDNTTSVPSLNVDVQMIKEIKTARLELFVYLERPTGKDITLFHGTDINGCDLLRETATQPLVNMFKEITAKSGVWPDKCPIAADYHYNFTNLTLESDYLPTFVPESKFKISMNVMERNISFWRMTISGSVVNKK